MINIEEVFQEITKKLIKDIRPQLRLSEDQHIELNQKWNELSILDPELFKILCILDNTISLNKIYEANIIKTIKTALKGKLDSAKEEVIVLTLGITLKHITGAYHKDSRRVPIEVLELFKELLLLKSAEIREWTLRNIEALGSQSAYLKKEVLDSRPGLLQLFNEHNKACAQIIELLERRWGPKP